VSGQVTHGAYGSGGTDMTRPFCGFLGATLDFIERQHRAGKAFFEPLVMPRAARERNDRAGDPTDLPADAFAAGQIGGPPAAASR